MKNENYITIQGWMRNKLNLKGNELMVYALIYGFSQDEKSEFTGSVAYIADWIGATKQTVHNCLKSLCEKKLLVKRDEFYNGVKFCVYKAVLPVDGYTKNLTGVVKKFDEGSQKNLPNNKDDKLIDKIDSNIYTRIVYYLNLKCGTHYKETTDKTRTLIKSRLKEGFTVDDFMKVIDVKAAEWLGTEAEKYLRPETLFGTKFEGYLNQKQVRREFSNQEIAAMLDEAERRDHEQNAGWTDAGEGVCCLPEHVSWDD